MYTESLHLVIILVSLTVFFVLLLRFFGVYIFFSLLLLFCLLPSSQKFLFLQYRLFQVSNFSTDRISTLSLNIVSTEDDSHVLDLIDVRNIVEALIRTETYCSARELYLEGIHSNLRYSMSLYSSCVTQAFGDLAFLNRKDLRSSLLIFLTNSSSLSRAKAQAAVFCQYMRELGGVSAIDKVKSCL